MRHSSKARLLVGFLAYLLTCAGVVTALALLPADARWVRLVLAVAAFVAALLFMVSYHVGSRGAWRRSDIGVHLMTFGLTNAIVMAFVVLAFLGWIPAIVLPFFSALTYLTVAGLFAWRTVIMVGYQRGKK